MKYDNNEINYFGRILKPSSTNLYYIYKTEFELKFDGVIAQKYSLKTARQLKLLIDEQGFKNSVDLIIWTIVNWNKVSKELNIKSYPTPQIIYGFRYSILKIMKEVKSNDTYIDKNEVKKRNSKNVLFTDD